MEIQATKENTVVLEDKPEDDQKPNAVLRSDMEKIQAVDKDEWREKELYEDIQVMEKGPPLVTPSRTRPTSTPKRKEKDMDRPVGNKQQDSINTNTP